MSGSEWTETTWKTLLSRVGKHQVTPVLGAGASREIIGDGATVAREWAGEIGFPLPDAQSLAAVAQYAAIDRASPGEYIQKRLSERLDAFNVSTSCGANDPLRYLTALDFKVWLTTNYDDLIERGLYANKRPPRVGTSLWAPSNARWNTDRYDLDGYEPTLDEPLVFHLHGHYEDWKSMVVSEADYLDFLERLGEREGVIPPQVEDALSNTGLLFIGYSFRDVNLQLLLRRWELPRLAYAVRPMPPNLSDDEAERYRDYFPRYIRDVTGADIRIYWGTGSEFCADLDKRLKAEQGAANG